MWNNQQEFCNIRQGRTSKKEVITDKWRGDYGKIDIYSLIHSPAINWLFTMCQALYKALANDGKKNTQIPSLMKF